LNVDLKIFRYEKKVNKIYFTLNKAKNILRILEKPDFKTLLLLSLMSLAITIFDSLGLGLLLKIINIKAEDVNSSQELILNALGYTYSITGDYSYVILILILIVIVLFAIKSFALYLESSTRASLIKKVSLRTQVSIFDYYRNLTLAKFNLIPKGFITNLLTVEIERGLFSFTSLTFYFVSVFKVISYSAIALYINPGLTFAAIALSLITLYIQKKISKRITSLSTANTQNSSTLGGLSSQFIQNFKYLNLTGGTLKIKQHFDNVALSLAQNKCTQGKLYGASVAASQLISVVILSLLILIGVIILKTPINLLALGLLLLYRALSSANQAISEWQKFAQGSESFELISDQYILSKNNPTSSHTPTSRKQFEGSIQIQISHVGYKIGNNTILSNVSLDLQDGKIYGLVGKSGSGKSTLLDLISTATLPHEGSILFNNQPWHQLKPKLDLDFFAAVTQDIAIFNDTIFNNVTLWDEPNETNFNKFQKSVIAAQALSFIEKMPQKEKTLLGETGVQLSGGQKQRLAIARELYKNPRILILDEACSALDAPTEKEIFQSLASQKVQKIIIIASHRPQALLQCDEIIVLDQGKIVEKGDYRSLISNRHSAFAELCNISSPIKINHIRVTLNPPDQAFLKFEEFAHEDMEIKNISLTGLNFSTPKTFPMIIGNTYAVKLNIRGQLHQCKISIVHRTGETVGAHFLGELNSQYKDLVLQILSEKIEEH
jgi:subfamily B ATP-binding cassette protein MsbA